MSHAARAGGARAGQALCRTRRVGPPLLIMMAVVAAGSAACATSGAVPRPFPGAEVVHRTPDPPAPGAPETSVASAEPAAPLAPVSPVVPVVPRSPNGPAVAQFALGFRGVPYRLGGSDPTGFDCSGLVQYVFAQYGIAIPRIVADQYAVGDRIKPSEIKAGDLLFFNTKSRGNGASHVGIAISQNNFVHAPNSAGVVRIETLSSSYWGSRYLGARRIKAS
jgi:cell wall-associated NlpC family hydrolase